MIGTRTSSSYTPHVDVAPADRPLILVAPRWEEAKPFLSETLSPNEEIVSVFVDAILAAGGLPLQMSITEDIEVIRHYVDIADGIAIPGGPDVNPKRWGDERPYDPTLCCEIRDRFEFKLVNEVLRAKKPLFTTCRGTQLLNVATGGTLCMDVPSLGAREGRTQWRHTHVLNDPVHPVEVVPGSLLERAVGGHRLIQTNSAHHCCVERLGKARAWSPRQPTAFPSASRSKASRSAWVCNGTPSTRGRRSRPTLTCGSRLSRQRQRSSRHASSQITQA